MNSFLTTAQSSTEVRHCVVRTIKTPRQPKRPERVTMTRRHSPKIDYGEIIARRTTSGGESQVKIKWWGEPRPEPWVNITHLTNNVYQVSILDDFIPKSTLVLIPKGTTILLLGGDVYQFGSDRFFFLLDGDRHSYTLVDNLDRWTFPHQDFPGRPFASFIRPPETRFLQAAVHEQQRQKRLGAYNPKIDATLHAYRWIENRVEQPVLLFDKLERDRLCREFVESCSIAEGIARIAFEEDWESRLTLFQRVEGFGGFKQLDWALFQNTLVQVSRFSSPQTAILNTEIAVPVRELEKINVEAITTPTQKPFNITVIRGHDSNCLLIFILTQTRDVAKLWSNVARGTLGKPGKTQCLKDVPLASPVEQVAKTQLRFDRMRYSLVIEFNKPIKAHPARLQRLNQIIERVASKI